MKTLMRYPKTILLIGLSLFVLIGCAPPNIKIGYLSPETGNSAELGVAGKRAATMAIEAINSTGGLHGAKLELIAMDDTGTADGALAGLKQLESQGIKIIVGPLTSAASTSIVPYATEKGLLLLSPLVSAEHWTGRDDYFIRIITSNRNMAIATAHKANQLKKNKILGLYEPTNHLYSQTFVADFQQEFVKNGGTFVGLFPHPSQNSPALAESVARILQSNVDGVVAIMPGMDLALLAQKLHSQGWKGTVFGAPWGMDDNLRQFAGNAASQILLCSIYLNHSSTPESTAFFNAYHAEYSIMPSMSACYSYEAIQALFQGLQRAQSPQAADLRKALLENNFKGLDTTFTIDAFGDTQREVYFYRIQDGAYVKI